ncbi:hypothetical protein Bbelb_378620 [Branchiostoma belcheri]|nr:hypothetical protein Bbelb_378620 [Branchiostoma belcheri]
MATIASDTKLFLEDTNNGESEDITTGSSQKEDVINNPKKGIDKDDKVQRKDAKCPKHTFGIEKETLASPSDSVTCTHTYPQPAAAELRYLHVGDHVVVYSGHESEDTYGYKTPEKVSIGRGKDFPSYDNDNVDDVHEYKTPENIIMRQSDGSPHYYYEKPEDAHQYKIPENMDMGHGGDSSSNDYEEAEDCHEYKMPENVNIENGEDSPSYTYETPEDAHEYKMPANVNTGYDEDSSSNEKPDDAQDPEGVSFGVKTRGMLTTTVLFIYIYIYGLLNNALTGPHVQLHGTCGQCRPTQLALKL